MRGWTDDEAVSAGRSDGFGWALRKSREDPSVVERYASGPAERRAIAQKLESIMQIAARTNIERFGAKDSRRRDEKVLLYIRAYVAAALDELARQADKRGLAVAL